MENTELPEAFAYCFMWNEGIEISRIRADLENLENLGATHIVVKLEEDIPYGDYYLEIIPA